MPTHEYFRELAALAEVGEISEKEHSELQMHLRDCPGCRHAAHEYREILFDWLPLGRSTELESDLRPNIRSLRLRTAWIIPIAALLVLAIAVSLFWAVRSWKESVKLRQAVEASRLENASLRSRSEEKDRRIQALEKSLAHPDRAVTAFSETVPSIKVSFFAIMLRGWILYAVRGGRRIIGRLELEGGFRFSLADRQTVGVFAEQDYSIPDPFYGRLIFLKGGNLFVSDLGFKWNLGRKKLSAFLYAGGGSVTRTHAAPLDTLVLLDILARQQNQKFIWRDLPLRHTTAYHLDFGAGAEISMGRRWGLRFEARDRIEPNSYPDRARHFVEITDGPSLRF